MSDETLIVNSTYDNIIKYLNKYSSKNIVDKLIEAEFELSKGNKNYLEIYETIKLFYSLLVLHEQGLLNLNMNGLIKVSKTLKEFENIINTK